MAQRICAVSSLSEKYQCPDLGQTKLEISPSIQTVEKCVSNKLRTMRVNSAMVKICSSCGIFCKLIMTHHTLYSEYRHRDSGMKICIYFNRSIKINNKS